MTQDGGLVAITNVMRDFAEGTTDYRRLLDMIARRVAETFGGACSVSIVSADGAWLHPVAVHVPDPGVAELVRRLVFGTPVRLDAPLVRQTSSR